jgi:hypothetical protein
MTLKLLHHCSPAVNGDVLDIVMHKNVRLDHVRARHLSDPVDKVINWEWFQSLVSESIQINSGEDADKVARDFTAFISSVYRLPTSKITLSNLNKDLSGLESLLKHKQMLRKMWQVTRDPASKTAVNWFAKTIR